MSTIKNKFGDTKEWYEALATEEYNNEGPKVERGHPIASMFGPAGTKSASGKVLDPMKGRVRYRQFNLAVADDREALERITTRCMRRDGAFHSQEKWNSDQLGNTVVVLNWIEMRPPEEDED